MKRLLDNKVVQIGIMAFLVIAACITFTFVLINVKEIISFIGDIISIMMPLVFGLVLAYIMHPIVNLFDRKVFKKVEKEKTRRNLSILCTLFAILGVFSAIFSIVLPELFQSIQSLIINVPDYLKDLEVYILNWLNDNQELKVAVMENYDKVAEYIVDAANNVVLPVVDDVVNGLSTGIFGVVNFLFNLVIGLVFAVYLLANTKKFGAGIRKTLYSFFDVDKVNGFIDEIKHINHVFGQFMVGKVCDSSIVALSTFLFLLIFGYPYPLLIAVIIGLTDLIPYFGPYIGTIPSALLICLVDPIKALTFILWIVVLQQIDSNLITPRIQTKATGLPSFWVLFAITLFGGLFGIIGLLIAVPCFTIIYELVCELVDKNLKKKSMPTEIEYYTKVTGIEKKKIKANID